VGSRFGRRSVPEDSKQSPETRRHANQTRGDVTMSSVTIDVNGAFANKIDLTVPSRTMRELMATETERWRQMEKSAVAAKKSLASRLSTLFGRH
jgi:hypothetical protein